MAHRPRRMPSAKWYALSFYLLTIIVLRSLGTHHVGAQEPAQAEGTPIWLPLVGNSATPTPPPTPVLPAPELPVPSYEGTFQGYSKEIAGALYKAYFLPARTAPTGYTGDPDNCVAGSLSEDRINLLLRQLNYFRSIAGTRQVTHNHETSKLSQAAALIMWRLGGLTHYPTEELECYTPEGAEGALRSTLSLRFRVLPKDTQLLDQMQDDGDNNKSVGHRFWLLAPETNTVGFGEIMAVAETASTALSVSYSGATYVLDVDGYGNQDWAVPGAAAVAWPPPGWVPWDLVFGRWSVAFAKGVDAANAIIEVTVDGVPVATTVIHRGGPFNTLVWELEKELKDLARVAEPVVQVHISGVQSSNPTMRDFTYTFRPFHP